MEIVDIQILKLNPKAKKPEFESIGSAGADLFACVDGVVVIKPSCYSLIPCGVSLEIPQGYEAQIRPRSGLALKYGVTVLNTPGTIDSDYRGEIKVILINHGKNNFIVNNNDRIAQLVFSKLQNTRFIEVDTLSETVRGSGGFGSTGIG